MTNKKRLTISILCLLMLIVSMFAFSACGGGKVENFNLSFKVDGENYSTISTNGSEIIAIPENPSKEGYTFDGWYWDKDVWNEPFTANSLLNAPISSDMSVYAKFNAISYDITYETDNGTHSNPVSYTIEDSFTLSDAEKNGYNFVGWYSDDAYTTEVTSISAGSMGAITLYAKYEVATYSITYENTKDATNNNATSYTIESATITLENLEKLGYTFDGWYNNGTKVTEIASGSTGNLILTAQWTPIGYEIKYHNIAGATHSNPDVYNVEDQPLVLSSASKTGYTFKGWYTDSACQNKITEVAIGTTGELNLYAGWEIIEYTATFKDGNDTVEEITFTVETETINEPSVPTHNGYNGKWADYVLGTSDITINAEYTPIVYTITYENTKDATNNNVTSYTIESATIILENIAKLGYNFDGWYNNGTKVTEIAAGSTGNLVLTAQWTAIQYNITYMYDDAIGDYVDSRINPNTYTVEDSFEFIGLVNKTTGYAFAGWYTEKNVGTGTKVTGIEAGSTGDITIYAHWALEEYTITYHNANGVTNTNATTYTVETDTFEIFDISKEGYTFNGWYSDGTFSTKVTEIAKGTTGNKDLYAKWTPIEYTIEYVLYGGACEGENNPLSYTIEDEITFTSPTLNGYTFVGFFTLAEGGERVTGIGEGTIGNKTLYARYIAFDTNGGSAVEYDFSVLGNKISEPTEPQMEYYTFMGWYKDEALTEKFDFTIPTKTLTLYAKFEPTVYKITYVLNGGTNSQNQVLEYTVEDTTVTLLNPTKTGYTFIGWFTNDKFTSSVVTELKNEHGDKTFYANYSINQYTISFETNGGTEVEAITQNYDTSVVAPSAPAKNGYKFEGWYSDSELKNAYTFTKVPAEDITLYAKWSLETYNITYNLVGGTNNSNNPANFNIQSEDITLQSPTKIGYNFAGWYADSEYKSPITQITSGTYGDVELYAKWDIITYTITYVTIDGTENINATTYTVEADLTSLADATLKGHSFNGWYKEDTHTTRVYQIGGGETGNITLYAKFTANTYDVWLDGTDAASFNVSFDLNGASGSIATQTITESNSLTYPTIPTRADYLFGGWYINKDCTGTLYDFTSLITSDIVLYAKWIKAENSISVNSNVNVTLNGRTEQKFTFVPLVSGNVTFTTTGSYDTLGILYDANGNVLKMDDDTGSDGVNFQIVFNVTAGEVYTISVSSYSSTTNGTTTLYVSGNNEVIAGGYVITGNKVQITYGSNFTLDLPEERDGYKFLGWADRNNVMYTDGTGASVRTWDKDETTLLVSVWEETVYTVTFETSGGTAVNETNTITLPYGARFDISKYVTTREGYTFDCWMLDGEEFNATTMPDHNITLTAKWKTFALGTIKYDVDKIAISANDDITADLFGAVCLDTNGQKAKFTVSISGTQVAGETITVRLTATSGGKTKVVTITDVKVYGLPSISFDETVEWVNIQTSLNAAWFSASGIDTFGEATKINVYVDGDYSVGDIATIVIESIDVAGNVVKGYIENIKLYGNPNINVENDIASAKDGITVESIGATATDSFGNEVSVAIEKVESGFVNGDVYTYTTSTNKNYVNFVALNSETYKLYYMNGASGDRTYIRVYCVTAGSNLKNASYYTNYGSYSSMTLSVTAGYEYYIETYAYSSSYTTEFSMYLVSSTNTVAAASEITVYLVATDELGNTNRIPVAIKVYGTPTISDADSTDIKVTDVITPELLGITSTDSYGTNLDISLSYDRTTQVAGSIMIVTAIVEDIAGNKYSKEFEVKVYGNPEITYDREGIKTGEDASIQVATSIVNFNLNYTGATNTPETQYITATNGLSYPALPTRDGYIFRGWFVDSACTTVFDFSKNIDKDITLYAGWHKITSDGFGNYVMNIINDNNTSSNYYSFYTEGTSSSLVQYIYFTALNTGTYQLYTKASSTYRIYMGVQNLTQNVVIRNSNYLNSTSFSAITINANAGDVICVEVYTSAYTPTFYMYVSGASLPEAGGISEQTGACKILNAVAKDSFGEDLEVTATLKEGSHKVGSYVIYTLTATDKLGNTWSIDTSPIGVYDVNDIKLIYNAYMSDIAKLTSDGSEFNAKATDSLGEYCTITIEAVEGYTLSGGKTISIYIVATDKAGNRVVSEAIHNIKIYDIPTAELTDESKGYTITENGDITFLFTVFDSFGEEIYAEITTEDQLVAGTFVTITVMATDDAGNTMVSSYQVFVLPVQTGTYIELISNDSLLEQVYVADVNQYTLTIPNAPSGYEFYGWANTPTAENETIYYTLSDGMSLVALETNKYAKLYAIFIPEGYTVLQTYEDLNNMVVTGNYIMLNDIDCNNKSLTVNLYNFSGVFDGNGKVIRNLKITTYSSSSTVRYSGLFYSTTETAIIKNLGIDVATYTYSGTYGSSTRYSTYLGGLIGKNGGLIDKCFITNANFTVAVNGFGGLVGYNDSTGVISNCYVEGIISGSYTLGSTTLNVTYGTNTYSYGWSNSGGVYISLSGICDSNYGTIDSVYSNVSLSATASLGNVVIKETGTWDGTYFAGSAGNFSVGGVSARTYGICEDNNGKIRNSFSDSTMSTSATFTGSITGKFQKYQTNSVSRTSTKAVVGSTANVENCYCVTGSISQSAVSNIAKASLTTEEFVYETLAWSKDIWIIKEDGEYPSLK